MNIHIVVVAYGLADDLLKLFESVNDRNITWHLFLHSRVDAVVQVCNAIRLRSPNVHFYDYGYNRGLAASWNEGLHHAYTDGADVALIANDDAYCNPGDVDRIAEYAMSHPDAYMVDGQGYDVRDNRHDPMGLSLAAVNRITIETIGYFDENFFPIYFEDIDWHRRAKLAGLSFVTTPGTYVVHQGSKSLSVTPANLHHLTFSLNKEYYIRKWGGDVNQEQFDTPFNDPDFGQVIPYQICHTPYGEHDRTDRHLAS